MRRFVKKIARFLFGDYSIYYIYRQSAGDGPPPIARHSATLSFGPVDLATVASSPDKLIREQSRYHGTGSFAYAYFAGSRVVGVCFYWMGERYQTRNFWPLADREAKLVQVITLPEMRGRGIATKLIASSCAEMVQAGFIQLYARIWHTNTPSLLAFQRAGWTRISKVIEVRPFGRGQPIRLCIGARPLGASPHAR